MWRLFRRTMKKICVYKGYGMYEKDSIIFHRALQQLTRDELYQVTYITPEEIKQGTLDDGVALLAIGGGFDLGLIQALESTGIALIRDFVKGGGSYLGTCSGGYFASDYIEFDKSGPLEVIGERFLKFFPGSCIGPLYKPYDYTSRKGAVAALINFKSEESLDSPISCKVFYNGGGYFLNKDMSTLIKHRESLAQSLSKESQINRESCEILESHHKNSESHCQSSESDLYVTKKIEEDGIVHENIEILARFQDLPQNLVAMVKCRFGNGLAVLSGVHFEYDADDIDDEDRSGEHLIPDLRESHSTRRELFCNVLNILGIKTKSGD